MGFRSQASTEYLLLVGLAVIVALVAAGAFIRVSTAFLEEYNAFVSFEREVKEVLLT